MDTNVLVYQCCHT